MQSIFSSPGTLDHQMKQNDFGFLNFVLLQYVYFSCITNYIFLEKHFLVVRMFIYNFSIVGTRLSTNINELVQSFLTNNFQRDII